MELGWRWPHALLNEAVGWLNNNGIFHAADLQGVVLEDLATFERWDPEVRGVPLFIR